MESVNKEKELNNSILDKMIDNIKFLGNIESEKIEIKSEEYKENNSNYISEHIYILSPN
jgi:hypothetical protein